MATETKPCFVCSAEIIKPNLLSIHESSFMLREIFEISHCTDDLPVINFETVCYCQECLNKIKKIHNMLEEIKKLQKNILEQKCILQSLLIQTCTNLKNNLIIDVDGNRKQQPTGMLHLLRDEIVSKLENVSIQPISRKMQAEELAQEYQLRHPSCNIQVMKNVDIPEIFIPTGNPPKQILGNKTAASIEFNKCSKPSINEESFDDDSHLNNSALKQRKSKNENITSSSSQKVNFTRSMLKCRAFQLRTGRKECEECGIIFSRTDAWKIHKIKAHGVEAIYNCELCSYGKRHSSELIQQMSLHSEERNFKCDLCSKTFIRKRYLWWHMKTHGEFKKNSKSAAPEETSVDDTLHKNWTEQYMNSITGQIENVTTNRFGKNDSRVSKRCSLKQKKSKNSKIGNSVNLDSHKNILKRTLVKDEHDVKTRFKCTLCMFGFRHASNFNEHMATHSNEKNFKCNMCCKTFKTNRYLNTHVKIHTGKFQCNVCSITFNKKFTLRNHEIKAHGTLKCNLCSKTFKVYQYLSEHMKRIHGGKFQCNVSLDKFHKAVTLRKL